MSSIDLLIEKGQFVLNAAYVLIFIAAYIVARMVVAEQESRAAQENLADLRGRKASNGLVKITRPVRASWDQPMSMKLVRVTFLVSAQPPLPSSRTNAASRYAFSSASPIAEGSMPSFSFAVGVVAMPEFLLSGLESRMAFLTRTSPGVHDVREFRDIRLAVIDAIRALK